MNKYHQLRHGHLNGESANRARPGGLMQTTRITSPPGNRSTPKNPRTSAER